MRTHRYLALTALFALVVGACVDRRRRRRRRPRRRRRSAASAPTAAVDRPPRLLRRAAPRRPRRRGRPSAAALAPIRPKRSSRTSSRAPQITFWTFYLSPTFDQYIKDTIARFKATYPGVKVKWEDHQATFQDDLNNAFTAGIAPDVINLSVSEGWVSDYAGKGLLLGLNRQGPEAGPGHLLPGPLERAAGQGRELPVPVVPGPQRRAASTTAIYQKAGLTDDQFPKTIDGLPAALQDDPRQDADRLRHPPDRQRPPRRRWSTRAASRSINDDGKAFTFNSPDGVAWLQMYVDMVKAGTRRQHRPRPRTTTASASRLLGGPGGVLPDRPEPRSRRQGRTTRPCTATSAWSRRRSASPTSPARA